MKWLILLLLAGCSGAKVRYDAAPSPVDLNQHAVLLETDCNGVNRLGFGQAGCSWNEKIEGTLTVHTPLPGSIHLISRQCGIDQTDFHPEKGGSFKYDLGKLAENIESFCRINIFVTWQLPQGMTSEYKLRGMTGRVYLRRHKGEKPLLSWSPPTSSLGVNHGVHWAQFRAFGTDVVETSEPMKLIVDLPKSMQRGKIRLYGCGHGEQDREFSGNQLSVPRDTLITEKPQKGACDLFGYVVGIAEDGSVYDSELVVSYEVFEVNALKLAASVKIDGKKVCYNTEDSVSLAVFNHGETNEASNKLSDCFSIPQDGKGRLGFFTHQGRAAYAVIDGGKVEMLQ